MESALRELGWQGGALLAAGRTDSGVHASGQVIAFDLAWNHTSDDLKRALNAHLPADVAARAARPVKLEFHPRYAARARRYQYSLFFADVCQPLRERYAWRVWPVALLDRLQPAASRILGTHDFAAFGAPHRVGGSTVRNIFRADWRVEGPGLIFEIVGNAFLYHMVRRLVSIQVDIGQGKYLPAIVGDYLEGIETGPYQGLAPAHGLELVEVLYPS